MAGSGEYVVIMVTGVRFNTGSSCMPFVSQRPECELMLPGRKWERQRADVGCKEWVRTSCVAIIPFNDDGAPPFSFSYWRVPMPVNFQFWTFQIFVPVDLFKVEMSDVAWLREQNLGTGNRHHKHPTPTAVD